MGGFPVKRAQGECAGWLTHNLQICPCYAEEQEKERKAELARVAREERWLVAIGIAAAIAGVVSAALWAPA